MSALIPESLNFSATASACSISTQKATVGTPLACFRQCSTVSPLIVYSFILSDTSSLAKSPALVFKPSSATGLGAAKTR